MMEWLQPTEFWIGALVVASLMQGWRIASLKKLITNKENAMKIEITCGDKEYGQIATLVELVCDSLRYPIAVKTPQAPPPDECTNMSATNTYKAPAEVTRFMGVGLLQELEFARCHLNDIRTILKQELKHSHIDDHRLATMVLELAEKRQRLLKECEQLGALRMKEANERHNMIIESASKDTLIKQLARMYISAHAPDEVHNHPTMRDYLAAKKTIAEMGIEV